MLSALRTPLTTTQREEVRILVALRWFLAAAAAFVIDYRHGTAFSSWITLNGLLGVALVLNGILQFALARSRPIPFGFPLAAGAYDLVGITAAIATVDGFANQSFILYYPALLGVSFVFSGWPSSILAFGTVLSYFVAVTVRHTENIDLTGTADQKAMVLRLSTMVALVLAANFIVATNRRVREIALVRERRRLSQVHGLREQVRQRERAVEEERRRIQREVHDGVSQGVFMLSLGLEGAARAAAATEASRDLEERLEALGRVAKGTLLETRGLLIDLGPVMAGEARVSELVRELGREFESVTGIAVQAEVGGTEAVLPASTVGQVYRVLQEGFANVYRHAGADAVRVTLRDADGRLVIELADNGSGFDVPASAGGTGHGLRTMAERARLLGGELEVESSPGGGTCLRLIVPAVEPADASAAGSDA